MNPNARNKLPELNNSEGYPRWANALQDYAFKLFKNNNIALIKTHHTLCQAYFKRTFPETYAQTVQELEAGGADVEAQAFTPLDPRHYSNSADNMNELYNTCLDHALTTGAGYLPWVYTMFVDIKFSLGPEMTDRVAAVQHGDIVGLFRAIKLAICHYEIFNPDDLEAAYSKCTMAGEGQNDLMRFIAALSTYIRRLEAAGYPVRDGKKQRVLLHGLNQDIFESFINHADRMPYDTYADMVRDLERNATKAHIMEKLRALKPGTARTMMVTDCTPARPAPPVPEAADIRLDRIEKILITMASAKETKQPSECYRFKAGTCQYGDKCRFSHGDAAHKNTAPKGGKLL